MESLNRRSKAGVQGQAFLPTVWRLPALVYGAWGVIALVAVEYVEQDDWAVLGWICGVALVYSLILLYSGFRNGAVRLLTDPFLVVVGAFSLYFLFGAMLLAIGPEDQANYVLQWHPTSARDSVLVTAMNLIGLAFMLFAAGYFPGRKLEKAVIPAIALFGALPMRKIFWIFLLVGASAKLQVLSVDIAAADDVVVLGIIRTLSGLIQLAILVGVLYQGKGERLIRSMAITLAIFDSAIGLLLFNKSATLMPLVVVFLGLYLRRPSIKLAVISLVALAGVFFVLVNPTGEARPILEESADRSLQARFQILEDVFEHDDTSKYGAYSWSRLCYTVPQFAAVELFNAKQGGEDVELLAWVFVPRILVPNKPIMTRSGSDFNEKITGSKTSSTGMGLFISGYYNLGAMGLVVASVLAGWILAIFAAVSRAVISSNSLILLPIGLLGSFMAFRIDGHFVADYLGPFGMVMTPFLILMFVLRAGASKPAARFR